MPHRVSHPIQVFVYGTLRRGACHAGLLRDARYRGPFTTAADYTLYDLGAFPGACLGGPTALMGEVYAITLALLRRLDHLEDYPHLYTRQEITTLYGPAWIYLLRNPAGRRLALGDWRYR